MKKFLAILIGSIVVVGMAAPAMAAKAKAPKSICWSYDGATKNIAVGFKKTSSIKFLDGKTGFYAVQGALNHGGPWLPASGSAYIRTPADPEMNVHLTSDFLDFFSFEIWWNLGTGTGNVWVFSDSAGTDENFTDLTEVDCETLDPTE